MYKMADALFQFKGLKGSNGFDADDHLIRLAETRSGMFLKKSLSHNILKEKAAFVEFGADQFFKSRGLPLMQPVPMDNGFESLVFDCNNDHVLKVRSGEPYAVHYPEVALAPLQTGYSQKLNVTYDIFPKAQKSDAGYRETYHLMLKGLMNGCIIYDSAPCNFGRVPSKEDKNKQSLVVIDSGALKNIEGIKDVFYLALAMTKPIYSRIPALHALVKEFKKVGQSLSGKTPQPPLMADPLRYRS